MTIKTRLQLLDEILADATNIAHDRTTTGEAGRVWVTADGKTRIAVLATDSFGRLVCEVQTDYDGQPHKRLTVRDHDHNRIVRVLEALRVVEFPHDPDPMPQELADARAELEKLRAKVKSLEEDSAKLTALEVAGVDNWSGYELAMDIWHEGADQ